MKNPEIELVKKWLDNPESVSAEERERAVSRAADAVYTAARTAVDDHTRAAYARVTHGYAVDDHAVYDDDDYAVAYAVVRAYVVAVNAAFAGDVVGAKYWVKEYEELTK